MNKIINVVRYVPYTIMGIVIPVLLSACGGGSSSTNSTPNLQATVQGQTAALTATALATKLSSAAYNAADNNINATGTYDINDGSTILSLASGGTGTLTCGVTAYHIQYNTVGGANEPITDSAALLVPTGSAAKCSGPRPIVLYAHGTETIKNYDMSNLNNPADDRVLMAAAMYASNGYIVVAPNYAGFDTSTLPYHPYLNAKQQSTDMIDALLASRSIITNQTGGVSGVSDNGKLFITGYSQGGFVAMATHKAMQEQGMTVTASEPSSGPYALAAMGDMLIYGYENEGATGLSNLVLTNFHNSYKNDPSIGDVYYLTGTAADAYASNWLKVGSTNIDQLFPGIGTDASAMIYTGQYPLAMFSSTAPVAADFPSGTPAAAVTALTAMFPALTPPTNTGTGLDSLFAASFGTNPLLKNSFRAAALADAVANPDGAFPVTSPTLPAPAVNPAFPFRRALKANDLRGWTPSGTVKNLQMCGGHNDPEVFFAVNTQLMYGIWGAQGVLAVTPYKDMDPYPNLASNTTAANAALPNTVQLAGAAAAAAFSYDIQVIGASNPALFAPSQAAALAQRLAADIPALVNQSAVLSGVAAQVGSSNALYPALQGYLAALASTDPLVQAFVAGIPSAVASELSAAAIQGAIGSTVLNTQANVASVAASIGALAGEGVLLSYHSSLVAPSCHADALKFFNTF